MKVAGNDLVCQAAACVQALGKKLSEARRDLVARFVLVQRHLFLNGENILVFSPGSCAAPEKNGVQSPRHQVRHSDTVWLWLQFDKGEQETRWLDFVLGEWILWSSMARHIWAAGP